MSNKLFQAGDIARILGIDRNRLFYWIKTHQLLKPDIEEAEGTGTRAKFSVRNMLELETIRELYDYGFTLNKIRLLKASLEKQFRKTSRLDVFESVLGSPDYVREFVQIKIRHRKNIFSFEYKGYKVVAEPDGHGGFNGPYYEPGEFEPLGSEDPSEGERAAYTSVLLEIGTLANRLLEKIKKE